MKKAYLDLISHALSQGHTVTVQCAEEGDLLLKNSKDYAEIKEAVECIDFSVMYIRDSLGERVGVAYVVLEYDQDPEDTISDYTTTPYMEDWWKAYSKEAQA